MTRRTAVAVAGAALSGCLALAGCSGLPTSGPVVREPDLGTNISDTSSYFTPPGPQAGDTPGEVVRGFLLAMQATPLSVAVAREFLTTEASDSWRPERRTLVYDGFPVEESDDRLQLLLDGAVALDDRGRWLGPQQFDARPLRLTRERGQWRLVDPPNALLVPASYFADRFTRASLGFLDPSARTIVPEPVHFPRGPQGATALVRALLGGPFVPAATRSFAPPGLTVDLSVSVSSTGAVEVPVSPQVLNLSRAELDNLAVQLSYTLGQVSGVNRIRLTTDGAPVATGPDGEAIPVDLAGTEDPAYAAAAGQQFGILDGRVVRVEGGDLRSPGEPWANTPSSVREVAVSLDAGLAAGVSVDGSRLLLAPLLPTDTGATPDAGRAGAPSVRGASLQPVAAGEDLRQLHWTRFGELWSLGGPADDAVVRVTVDGRSTVVDVPGVTGERVEGLLVSRDGSRVVAAVGTAADRGERLVVARVVRGATGDLTRVTSARPLPLLGGLLADGSTRVVDLAWTSATEMALLLEPPTSPRVVERVAIDGSPVESSALTLAEPPDDSEVLVASPDPESGIRVVTGEGEVFQLSTSGTWLPLPLPELDGLTWVG